MNDVSSKSRLVAVLLAFFLGMFGIHRFYVGKVATGVVQLILTITLLGSIISGIWVFIDFILILCGVFTDKEGKKIRDWDPKAVSSAPVAAAAPAGAAASPAPEAPPAPPQQ